MRHGGDRSASFPFGGIPNESHFAPEEEEEGGVLDTARARLFGFSLTTGTQDTRIGGSIHIFRAWLTGIFASGGS